MHQFKITKIDSNIDSSDLIAALTLGMALLGIAAAAILIVIAEQEIGPNATTFNRLGIAAIAFGLWNVLKRLASSQMDVQPTFVLGDLGLLLIAGVSFALSLTLWAWSLTQTSVANSTLLNNMMPIFTTLGAWVLLHQRFELKFLLGMAIALGGAVTICIEDLQVAENNIVGDTAALLAAMLSATSILSIEQLRAKFSTPIIMLWTSLIGSLLLFPIALLSESQLFPTSWRSWLAVIALGIVSQFIGQGLLTYSLKRFSSGLVAVSMLAIPVIAAILATVVLSEKLSLVNWLAFLVVLLGIYLAVSAQDTDTDN